MPLSINQHWETMAESKLSRENAFDVDGVEHSKNDDAAGDVADNKQPLFRDYAAVYIDDLKHL